MKKHILIALAAFALPCASFAQAKKAAAPQPAAPAATKTVAAKPAEAKAMPMNSRVDEIDAAGKTFTQVTRDGRKVKHVITSNTTIKQGEADARFEDLKVGDMVSGMRVKKSADEYEVVKITKFGPAAPKDTKEKKEAAPKPAAPAKGAK